MNWWKKNIQPYLVKTSVVTLLTFLLTWSVLPTLLDFSAVMSLQDADSFRMSDFYNRVAAHSADKYASDRLLCLTYDGFSRDTIAQVLEKIAACCQPAAVGVDFHFLLPQDNDARLVAAMQALHDRLVLPVTVAGNDSDGYVLRGKPCFADSLPEVRFGAVNLAGNYFLDVIRDFPPFFVAEGDTCRNIAVELAWLADPVTTERFLEANKDRELITISYPFLQPDTLSAASFLREEEDWSAWVNGRAVLIGAVKDIKDTYQTPLPTLTPGLMIHAYTAGTILREDSITESGKGTGWVWAVILCFLLTWINCLVGSRLPDAGNGLMRIFQFLVMLFLLWFGYFSFVTRHVYYDLSHAVMMLLLLGFAYDLYGLFEPVRLKITAWLHKHQKKRKQ